MFPKENQNRDICFCEKTLHIYIYIYQEFERTLAANQLCEDLCTMDEVSAQERNHSVLMWKLGVKP